MNTTLRILSLALTVFACLMGDPISSWALDVQEEATLKLQEQDQSRAAAAERMTAEAAMQSLKIRKLRSVSMTGTLVPRGFRDGDDYSSLPYLLNPDELQTLGMKVDRPEIPKVDWRALKALKRESPV